ncbi:MAG: carbon monoxide dehydrogenase [Bacteroidales bacterium]|nr:carbon monoxide dehydrogenase [Bacteroidales bacterium]
MSKLHHHHDLSEQFEEVFSGKKSDGEILSHAHAHAHEHHDSEHPHVHGGTQDYIAAVNAYRKTFPNKQQQIEQTPDPAVREMLLHMQELGIETVFDRFDAQQPQCNFGIAGVCCKNCFMGPCRITKKAPRGVCGADADLIGARNLLRHLAAGTASHGARGRASMLALKYASEGKAPIDIEGKEKILAEARTFGLETEGKDIKQLAGEIADILLEDLSRTVPGKHRTIYSHAPKERVATWEKAGIIPISPYHEVFESLHRTTTGTDGDWRNVMQQFLRTGVSFAWSSCLGSGIAMDCLYGLPHRSTSKVNLGALKKGWVNIAVHGHSPLLIREIVKIGQSDECQALAREAGASGIQFYGICCSGLSAMYRYGGVIPLSNAVGSELVLGTGALDLWVADVQDVFPTIMDVAKCFRTVVVTTSDSARLPEAEHYGFDHEHSNIGDIKNLAKKIVLRGIEAFKDRRDVPVKIPQYEVEAEMGFSVEWAGKHFDRGLRDLADALREGRIRGIVNLVGCNNPRLIYEKHILQAAEILLRNNILILTNGCASFALLKTGFCSNKALEYTGSELAAFCREHGNIPPVWHLGECLDNARASGFFNGISGALGIPIKSLPYAFISPEYSNEKGICAALAFRLLGMNSYHSVYAPTQGAPQVNEFMEHGTKSILGSEMVVNVDTVALAEGLVKDLNEKRMELGWK